MMIQKTSGYDAVAQEASYDSMCRDPSVVSIDVQDRETEYSDGEEASGSGAAIELKRFDGHAALISHDKKARMTIASSDNAFLLPSVRTEGVENRSVKRPFLSGWRIGALLSLFGAVVVFILNLVLTIVVLTNSVYKVQDGLGTLFEGSCSTTRKMNVWAHLLINALSTLLLSASNYCMQVLSSPNRAEVDRAHAQRFWLHIGIPSIHNLKYIGGERSVLWAILMVSSMPLHLLYNSMIFTNLQANSYIVVPTMDDWLFGGTYNFTNFIGFEDDTVFETILRGHRPALDENITLNNGTESPRFRNISTEDCFRSFDTQYASSFGNVYLAQAEPTIWRNQSALKVGVHNRTGRYLWYVGEAPKWFDEIENIDITMPFRSDPDTYPSNRWRCPPLQNSTCGFPMSSEEWRPYESSVKYCMIEQVAEICKLQFSFLIASILLVSNLVKIACISRLFLRHSEHHALVTLGDAVANFLEHPDIHTIGRCLPSEVQIDRAFNGRTFVAPQNDNVRYHTRHQRELENQTRRFDPKRIRWAAASSYGTWLAAYVFYLGTIIFGTVAITMSLRGMPKSVAELWRIGFGSVDGRNLLTANMSLLRGVMLANSPQALLSYLYVTFNRLYTSMLLGKEWSSYLHERKPLRVTTPIGRQRSTYWLSVPYRYALPMITVSGAFHWLASQSLFMVQITVTETQNDGSRKIMPTQQISTCGFSPFAIILTTVTATFIAIGGVALGRFRYPAGMPLASSCSAVMSAACHPMAEDLNAHMLPVQWGAVFHGSADDAHDTMSPGHCSFSSWPVEMPIPGRVYA